MLLIRLRGLFSALKLVRNVWADSFRDWTCCKTTDRSIQAFNVSFESLFRPKLKLALLAKDGCVNSMKMLPKNIST